VTDKSQELVIIRTFNAPRNLVFKAFAEAKRLALWWGPKGFIIKVNKLDFRPGGIFHYAMEKPGQPTMCGKFIYREIFAPEQITFINSFADEQGEIIRAPFSNHWPLEVLINVTLEAQQDKTKLTLRSEPVHANQEEIKLFAEWHTSMLQGFGGTFDQLDDFLSKV
jgi:uncharacterized protein YndB with AHSA1/START domain